MKADGRVKLIRSLSFSATACHCAAPTAQFCVLGGCYNNLEHVSSSAEAILVIAETRPILPVIASTLAR